MWHFGVVHMNTVLNLTKGRAGIFYSFLGENEVHNLVHTSNFWAIQDKKQLLGWDPLFLFSSTRWCRAVGKTIWVHFWNSSSHSPLPSALRLALGPDSLGWHLSSATYRQSGWSWTSHLISLTTSVNEVWSELNTLRFCLVDSQLSVVHSIASHLLGHSKHSVIWSLPHC